jgi:hypothetical protein
MQVGISIKWVFRAVSERAGFTQVRISIKWVFRAVSERAGFRYSARSLRERVLRR